MAIDSRAINAMHRLEKHGGRLTEVEAGLYGAAGSFATTERKIFEPLLRIGAARVDKVGDIVLVRQLTPEETGHE